MDKFVSLVLKRLTARYGRPQTGLGHSNKRELLVGAILSAQCTDVQVNKTTKALFKRFRSFDDYANADLRTLKRYLCSLNYYKTKARHLKGAAKGILEKFGGKVPRTLKELMELDGVGRKVANVVLSEGFGINEGITVDTHVAVTARRLGLSASKDPYKIELDLQAALPKKDWGKVSNLLIELGRDTCTARNKECARCVLKDVCPSSDVKPPHV